MKRSEHKIINGIECCQCSACLEWKSVDEFYSCSTSWDGIRHTCKKCKINMNNKYKMNNREYYLRKRQEYYSRYKTQPTFKEYVKKYSKEHAKEILEYRQVYKTNNRDKIKESNRQYREQNKEWLRETHRIYRQSAKGRLSSRQSVLKRRSKLSEVEFTLSKMDWIDVIKSQSNRCEGCGVEFSDSVKAEVDHIFPLSLGGGTTKANVQALCRSCNSSKGNRTNWTYPYVREWT